MNSPSGLYVHINDDTLSKEVKLTKNLFPRNVERHHCTVGCFDFAAGARRSQTPKPLTQRLGLTCSNR